jgi:hypothetical protein
MKNVARQIEFQENAENTNICFLGGLTEKLRMITQKVKIYQMKANKGLRTVRVLMSEDLRAVRYGWELAFRRNSVLPP